MLLAAALSYACSYPMNPIEVVEKHTSVEVRGMMHDARKSRQHTPVI
jgi:hypothetical protein